jgi:hypothetical protein
MFMKKEGKNLCQTLILQTSTTKKIFAEKLGSWQQGETQKFQLQNWGAGNRVNSTVAIADVSALKKARGSGDVAREANCSPFAENRRAAVAAATVRWRESAELLQR